MPSLLQQEIRSQPAVLANLLAHEADHVRAIVAALPPFQFVVIAARGTSDHAATYAKYIWGALAGLPVALAAPALHTLYDAPPRLRGALVIGISQSGQSPDIVAVLASAAAQGCPTIAITNDPASPLAAAAAQVIALHAGPEQSVAATKTYTAQLAVIALLAAAWSGDPQRFAELAALPAALTATLAGLAAPPPTAAFQQSEQCVLVGRGFNYPTALEIALKLKELTYLNATAYSAADFRHGPIATIAPGLPVILIMPSGATRPDLLALAHDLAARDAALIVVSDDVQSLPAGATTLALPTGVPEWLSPILAVVPGQLLALGLALAKGFDPDHPRGLKKSP